MQRGIYFKINVNDIIDRVIIVHKDPDDFITQPTGAAGEKIACGEIKAFYRLVWFNIKNI